MGSLWYHGHTICVSQGLTLSTASLVLFAGGGKSSVGKVMGKGERLRSWAWLPRPVSTLLREIFRMIDAG